MKQSNTTRLDKLIALTEKHLEKIKEVGEETPEFAQEVHKFHDQLKQLDNQ